MDVYMYRVSQILVELPSVNMMSIRDMGAIAKRKESQPFSSSRKSRRLLFRTDLGDRAMAIRVKAKVNHPGVGETSGILANQCREFVSIVTSLDTLDEIALRGRDPGIMGHHSPNH